jgi:hypothetical protein
MADNLAITAGVGTNIGTDDVGGVHFQKVKLVDGTADSSTAIPGDANRGLKVNPGVVTRISLTATGSTIAYAAGDALGGLLTFPNAARFSGGGAILTQVVVLDKDQEQAPIDLVLFDRTFTPSADNAAFDPTDADLANVLTAVSVTAYSNFNDNCIGMSDQLYLPVLLNGTSLFGQMVVRGTPTYTATNDLTVILSLVQE